MRKKRLWCLLFASIAVMLLSGCFWYLKHFENVQYIGSAESFSLPLERYMYGDPNKPIETGIRLLDVKVNSIDCTFIVDTGATNSVLSKDFCRIHSLTGKKKWSNPFTRSNIDDLILFEVNVPFEVGEIKVAEHQFIVLNLENLSKDSITPFAGILGLDFLDQYIYSINMRDGILGFITEADYHKETGVEIPIEIRGNKIYFNLDFEGKPVEFLLDTGASKSEVNGRDIKHIKGKRGKVPSTTFDINGKVSFVSDTIELTGIKLGSLVFKRAKFHVSKENIAGADILRSINIVVNPLKKRMILTLSKPHPIDRANTMPGPSGLSNGLRH